jgi:acyl-CoA thioesterase II
MANFVTDTDVSGGDGRYEANLSSHWEVWGPLGGYVAAIALRAIGRETELRRPASIACQFLSVAKFDAVQIEVATLRRGKRSHALHARMTQGDTPVLAATAWVTDAGMRGLEHDHAEMPRTPAADELKSYAELSPTYSEWYPAWHHAIDGRPVEWSENPDAGPPSWQTWMRLMQPAVLDDPFLDAARSLMWLDLMMWNAALKPHLPWPISHLAPNLDVTAIFHDRAAEHEWLLCDSRAPVGRDGLVGCDGRVWSPAGKLIASGSSCLFCRPNPQAAE